MRLHTDDALTGHGGPGWAAGEERGSILLVRLLLWIALTLGRRLARLLLYPICAYFILFAPNARRASREYLSRALGRPSRLADTYRHFHTFAATLLDRAFLLNERFDLFDVRVQGHDLVSDMWGKGQGSFMLGAHFGSFEVLHAYGREQGHLKVSLVMYEEASKRLNAVLRAVNPSLIPQVIALGRLDSILNVEAALQRGEFIGMLADRSIRRDRMVDCNFLGANAHFPLGPFRIARLLDCPVILMFCICRGDARYDIHFERLAEGGVGSPREMLERYVERLEHYCRQAPYNWYNFYDFWK